MKKTEEKNANLVSIHEEVDRELANKDVVNSLIATTFKKFTPELVKKAIVEGMIRGFQFKDFLEKNVYAISYGNSYSLVTSIDYSRKIGARSGVVGITAPVYEIIDGKVSACTVTAKKKIGDYIGDFTATVYFDEYYKAGTASYPSLWDTKPKTMIAKVAEMHALRMACPEELAQAYVEEEMGKEQIQEEIKKGVVVQSHKLQLESAKTIEDLQKVWANMPFESKKELKPLQLEIKEKLTSAKK